MVSKNHDKTDVILGAIAVADILGIVGILIISIILLVFGIFVLGSLISVIFNGYVILISLLLIIALYLIGKNRNTLITVNPVYYGLILGFVYWIYGVATFVSQNAKNWYCSLPFIGSAICTATSGISAVLSIPLLLAYMIAFILWIFLIKSFITLITG
jgi:hypothetical protein